ncbi:MAG: hypothetical protein BWY17_04733 [Deltaproteobacteria bacterium ADurb.Bin207]|nr:MAG: hypothetical protein BWY17_04733 [Deltaproteobacteria bacterium ADurb.Bin207]
MTARIEWSKADVNRFTLPPRSISLPQRNVQHGSH